MKNYQIGLILASLFLVAPSCQSSKQSVVDYGEMAELSGTSRTYNVAPFTRIKSFGIVRIHFSQSATTSVKAVSSSGLPDFFRVKSHNGTLTVYMDKSVQYRKAYPQVDLYVTAPSINAVDLGGKDSFEASRIETKWFSADLSGYSKLKIGKIKANNVKIESSGFGNVTTNIEAEDLNMENSGNSRVKMKFNGKKAVVENAGMVVVDLHFNGDNIYIENSGITTMTATLDCKQLTVDNSGNSKLTLIGTADNMKIDNSGISKVNTEGLNKY